jgi:small-conductance mechanosensitive channel
MSLQEVNGFLSQWKQQLDRLETWQVVLGDRLGELEQASSTASRDSDEMRLAEEFARRENLPEAVLEGLANVISHADSVGRFVRERIGELLVLQSAIADEVIVATDAISEFEERRAQVDQSVLRRGRPIWAVLEADEAFMDVANETFAGLGQQLELIDDYLISHPDGIILAVLALLAVLVLMVTLRPQMRALAGEQAELRDSARVFDFPVSAAIVIALVLVPPLNPKAPVLLWASSLWVATLPAARILLGLFDRQMRRLILSLSGFVIVNALLSLLPEASAMDRVGGMILGVLVVGALIAHFQPGGARDALSESRLGRFVLVLTRIGFGAVCVALLANIAGFGHLAGVLLSLCINTAYMIFVVYVAALALDGLWVVGLQSPIAQRWRVVQRYREEIRRGARRVIHVAAFAMWLWVPLYILRIATSTFDFLVTVLAYQLKVGSFSVSLGDVAAFVIALYISIVVSRLVRFVLDADVLPRVDLPRGVPGAISRMSGYVIVAIGFFVALGAAGIELSRFALVVGALGVGIGFGLQDIINNFISGLILMFERPIQVGDAIEFGQRFGHVTRIGIRSSIVQTFDGAEVNVPNGHLVSNEVVNWTMFNRRRRIEVPVGVAYGSDPKKVSALLRECADGHEDILAYPESTVLFKGFGESSLDFELRCWTGDFEKQFTVRSDLVFAIHEALYAAGIQIPFPQRDLHLRTYPEELAGRPAAEKPEARSGEGEELRPAGKEGVDSPEDDHLRSTDVD